MGLSQHFVNLGKICDDRIRSLNVKNVPAAINLNGFLWYLFISRLCIFLGSLNSEFMYIFVEVFVISWLQVSWILVKSHTGVCVFQMVLNAYMYIVCLIHLAKLDKKQKIVII